MIVYLFNEDVLLTINLPIKISGMYPLYVQDRLIANILSSDNKWVIQLSNEFMSNDFSTSEPYIIPYKVCTLISNFGGENYKFVVVPKYDTASYTFNIFNEITIGNNPNCDIYYSYDDKVKNGQEVIKLTPVNNRSYWNIESNSRNVFISGKRIINGEKLFYGDYIFFYGLKVILVGSRIIVNNPNNGVRVRTGNIQSREIEPEYQPYTNTTQTVKDDTPLFSKDDYFFKAPRFNFIVKGSTVKIDEPPAPEQENETPFILTIGPQLTMISTSVISMISFLGTYVTGNTSSFRFFISMTTMVVTILGALLWPNVTRIYSKRRLKSKEKNRQKKYLAYLQKKKKDLDLIKANQKSTILNNHPSAKECLNIIESKSKELWQRSIDHEDFLSIRLGIGTIRTKLTIDIPEEKFSVEKEDNLFTELRKVVDESLTIEEVPITYTFTEQSINAIVGDPELIKEFMDCVFLQMLTFHSYTDLKIVVFTKEPSKWEYLKIAPHCWNNQKSIRYFATTVEELSTIANDLEKTFDARLSDSDDVKLEDDGTDESSRKDFQNFRPYYLFFIDDMTSVRNVSLINKILHYKKNMGFSIIITSKSISTLPSETSDFICISKNNSAIMTSKINDNQKIFIADFNVNGEIDVYKCAQKLANIPVLVEKEKYELPSSLSFLELYNLGRVEQLNSIERWSNNNPVISLAVPIGIDQSGEIFKMDIHEKAYGPHGLVAGTTGSGKSEWIVTYILSLAVNFSPEEVQFVLIDYKGGGLAKSFENAEMQIKLPHLAGTITNLDKSEIFRSIAAIDSELKRRQKMFNEAREKLKEGSMNIYKYQQFYRKGLLDEPLSHLLIICDEFAELKQQQPEFMEQLISTSRIGRSLGVHLILATQKPSGVVTDQIWSNSKFKVCLKVQDKGDSNEILKKPDAAFLKQTGAFYLQVGNDDYYNLGQSAWAGAKYYPSDVLKHKVDESIQYIDNIGRTIGYYEEKKEEKGESQGEELLNIVAYITEISKQFTFKNSPLWLENIKDRIFLNELYKKYNRNIKEIQSYTYDVPIGEYDEPRKQMQGLLTIDLMQGNVAIIGQNGSGIDSLISTIIWSTICEHTPYEVAFYIIDFGAETLKKFAKFPHVGEVVFQDDMEKVAGVLDLIMEEMDKRKEILSDYNGSFAYYNKVNEKKLNLIVMCINSFDIFIQQFGRLDDVITNLFRDAPKYGIIFLISVNAPNALRQRQLQFFNHVIVMQLNDDSQYRTITNCRKGLMPKKNVGRGICKTDATNSDSYCEFQTAMIDIEERELETIKDYANRCVEYYKYKVKQLAKIPDNVTSDDLLKFVSTLSELPIGINFYEKDLAKYNLLSQKIHLITGKSIRDNINFIYGLCTILTKTPNVKVRVVDMMDIFKKPILDIKLFNEDIDVVFGALEKDVINRTDSDDYAVNIILGAGQYKRKLSKGGLEIFNNILQNLPNSKKSIYIFIDDYDKLRILKLEKWFDQVDTSTGLWLGINFANQSLFTHNEVSTEDKKYDYEGLAFNIVSGEYKVIKTVMDGDD